MKHSFIFFLLSFSFLLQAQFKWTPTLDFSEYRYSKTISLRSPPFSIILGEGFSLPLSELLSRPIVQRKGIKEVNIWVHQGDKELDSLPSILVGAPRDSSWRATYYYNQNGQCVETKSSVWNRYATKDFYTWDSCLYTYQEATDEEYSTIKAYEKVYDFDWLVETDVYTRSERVGRMKYNQKEQTKDFQIYGRRKRRKKIVVAYCRNIYDDQGRISAMQDYEIYYRQCGFVGDCSWVPWGKDSLFRQCHFFYDRDSLSVANLAGDLIVRKGEKLTRDKVTHIITEKGRTVQEISYGDSSTGVIVWKMVNLEYDKRGRIAKRIMQLQNSNYTWEFLYNGDVLPQEILFTVEENGTKNQTRYEFRYKK